MKVLVIGSGGREHAMVRALATTLDQDQIFIAPGNPGTAELATNLDLRRRRPGRISELGSRE